MQNHHPLAQYFEGLLEGGRKNANSTYVFFRKNKNKKSSIILHFKNEKTTF